MRCPSCSAEVGSGAPSCPACGHAIEHTVWPMAGGLALWREPDSGGEPIRRMSKDVTLSVLGEEGRFLRVRLPDGEEGYVPASAVTASSQGGFSMASSTASAQKIGEREYYEIAPFPMRVCGFLIDIVISGVLAFTVYTMVFNSSADGRAVDYGADSNGRLAALGIWFVYECVIEAVGVSPGKLLLGMRIIREDSQDWPGPLWGFVRVFVRLATAAFPLGIVVNHLWAAWDDDTQTLHDKAAGTIVVKSRFGAPSQRRARQATPSEPDSPTP